MAKEPIRVLIVDDEPLAREGIRLLLEKDPEIDIVGECGDADSAARAVRAERPALVFLDVQMPGGSGFDVLIRTADLPPPVVVFVTAFDQYALRAFEACALDYLLKPFDDDRFVKTLSRAKRAIRERRAGEMNRQLVSLLERFQPGSEGPPVLADPGDGAGSKWLTRLAIKSSGRVVFVRAEEIDWIGAADYYVEVHVGDKAHLLREPMTKLEARLDPRRFIRIHRSSIVNVDRVAEVRNTPHGDSLVLLHDGTKLRMSRSRRDRLGEMLRTLG